MKTKRLIAMLLCLALVFCLAACETTSSSKQSSSTKKTSSSSNNDNDSATDSSEKSTEPAETEAAPQSNWRQTYYVDEFQQPTNEGYITNISYFVGTFSNSATSNSKLYVQFLVDAEDVCIKMYEYGSYLVKNSSSSSSDIYDITLQNASGTKYNLSGMIYPGSDRIVIDENDKATLLNALKSGGEIKLYMVESEYTVSTYLFTVDTAGFAELYNSL